MAAKIVEKAIQDLASAGAAMRCEDLRRLLETLGFEVRDGARGGHKVFVHAQIKDFLSSSYDCGHGRNSQVKRPYIKKVLAILRQYESDLNDYLENRDD